MNPHDPEAIAPDSIPHRASQERLRQLAISAKTGFLRKSKRKSKKKPVRIRARLQACR